MGVEELSEDGMSVSTAGAETDGYGDDEGVDTSSLAGESGLALGKTESASQVR